MTPMPLGRPLPMPHDFDTVFQSATATAENPQGNMPYHYQRRLACGERGDRSDAEWLASGTECTSRLINIPTGLGKTAAVVLAWLWNRVALQNPAWPRRLVYCLPMRTLVEQTEGEIEKWLCNLRNAAVEGRLQLRESALRDLLWLAGTKGLSDSQISNLPSAIKGEVGKPHSPVVLMGGEELDDARRDWDIHPERPAILIGTQDMLLSRALNRGYGMSRARWPMHFGLLNNDCVWVLDETQLMGPGLGTACQLEAFRSERLFKSFNGAKSVTWYASATADLAQLNTRDWRDEARGVLFKFGLTEEERNAQSGPVAERLGALKQISAEQTKNFGNRQKAPDSDLIQQIVSRHRVMLASLTKANAPACVPRRTLVICNTVDRAARVHAAITSAIGATATPDLLLLHSRFRARERRTQAVRLKSDYLTSCPHGQIVIATQVIEAGVNLSSALLWSEAAPLASLVQRLGRLNRSGEFGFNGQGKYGFTPHAVVIGIEAPAITGTKDEKAKKEAEADRAHLPYVRERTEAALEAVALLQGNASPRHLETIQGQIAASIERCPYSLQRHELLDFFDTDANLSLGFTDVSPFVRGLDADTDLQVLWRDWPDSGKGAVPDFSPNFQRDELCSVSIGKVKDARNVLNRGWLWRGNGSGTMSVESGWINVAALGDIAPGMTILLPCIAGGYDAQSGWTGSSDGPVASCYVETKGPTDEEQLSSLANGWQSIAVHTDAVAQELRELLRHLLLNNEPERNALTDAVPWHDIGKNHPEWREAAITAVKEAGIAGREQHQPFAKFSLSDSPSLQNLEGDALKKRIRELRHSFRPGIAHEVASALAFRQAEQERLGPEPENRDTNLFSLLAEYVIMSHHGRVRKVLRDEIPRFPKDDEDVKTVRGVAHGSAIPPVGINDQLLGCDSLSTDCRKMGREVGADRTGGHESYTRGVLRLLEHYGPFRLAYFEAIFRAADVHASIKARGIPNA